MRTKDGCWDFNVLVGGVKLQEHLIDERTCVEAQPSKEFDLQATYNGAPDYFFTEFLIDGKSISGKKWIDAVGDTSVPLLDHTCKHWEKRQEDNVIKHRLVFEKQAAAGAQDDESRPAGIKDWNLGKFTLRIYQGFRRVMDSDSGTAGHNADLRKTKVEEAFMVKNGLSTAAGAGVKTFEKAGGFRAGQVVVGLTNTLLAEYDIFFRDSFFMCLNDDTCCHGKCKAMRDKDQQQKDQSARERAGAGAGGGSSSSSADAMRENLFRARETSDALSRKRPHDEGVIDLCDSDDDDVAESKPKAQAVD